ncbi:hypothetical protein [Arthrobacter psychrolactophilus]
MLVEHGEVEGLGGGLGPDVGFIATEGVGAGLTADGRGDDRAALELVSDRGGDFSEYVTRLLAMNALGA